MRQLRSILPILYPSPVAAVANPPTIPFIAAAHPHPPYPNHPTTKAPTKMASSTDEYRFYSSDSGKSPGDHQTVLQKGRLDSLVSTFDFPSTSEKKVIVLSKRPGPNKDTTFAANYGWSKWLQNFDSKGQFTLTCGEDLQIQGFKFRLKPVFSKSWNVEFSSDSTALYDAFGVEADQIAAPGVEKTKEILICALVKPDSKLTATVEDLFFYAGLPGNPLLGGLRVTLDESNYLGNRNAMWFDPAYNLQTTIRLQFGLDDKDVLQRLIDNALTPRSNMQRQFKIEEVYAVCQKVLTEGETSQGLEGIDNGDVSFGVACALVEGAKRSVTMEGGVKCSSSGITFTLTMTSANALQGILLWLGEVISDTLQIDSFFGGKGKDDTESVFGDLNLRQISISLDTGENRSKPGLSSFRIDIEVPAHFGKDTNGRQPVFMASYVWSQEIGNLGRISAQLWTPGKSATPTFYSSVFNLCPNI